MIFAGTEDIPPISLYSYDASHAMPAVTTLAVATRADLDTIPSVVAQLPPFSDRHDIELQNDSSCLPVAVATGIRGNIEQQSVPELHHSSDSNTNSKWRYRREDRPLVSLFCTLILMAVAVTLHEVLPSATSETKQVSTSFVYHEYPPLTLAETDVCQAANNSYSCYWKQIGNDLVGLTTGDIFGTTLRLGGSAEGSRFSATAPLYGMNQGLTRIFDIIEGNCTNTTTEYFFQQVGKSIVGKYENDTQKGTMTDDGHHLIMSSVRATLNGQPHVGHFGSFQISPGSLFELYGNEMYGKSSLDSFGTVAVGNRDGTIVAISDIEFDLERPEGNITNAGVVSLFRYNKQGNIWKNLGQRMEGSSTNEYFGSQISVSGDGYTVAIGSRNLAGEKGKVQVFKYDQGTEWQYSGTIVGKVIDEQLGVEMELSANGKVLAVTTDSSNTTNKNDNGVIRVFEYNEDTNKWLPLGRKITSDLSYHSDFGYQLRTSDDGMRLAISERKFSPNDELVSAGRVKVYDYVHEEHDWVPVGDVIGRRRCDFGGTGFDLSPDGSRLIGKCKQLHFIV